MKHSTKGICYMLLSTLCFAIIGLLFKLLTHIPIAEIICTKAIVALIIGYSTLSHQQVVPILGKQKGLLLLRGLSSGLGITLFFITLIYLPLATANVLQNTSPIFTAILGIFILKESISLRRWLFFMLAFLGVGLVYGRGFGMLSQSAYMVILGLISPLLMGFSNNFSAKLKDSEHPLVIFNYSSICILLLTGFYCYHTFVFPTAYDCLLLLVLGVVSYMAEYLAIRAYQMAPVAHVSAISYLGIPYALFIDLFLGETFPWTSFLGIGLVILGVLLNLLYK